MPSCMSRTFCGSSSGTRLAGNLSLQWSSWSGVGTEFTEPQEEMSLGESGPTPESLPPYSILEAVHNADSHTDLDG